MREAKDTGYESTNYSIKVMKGLIAPHESTDFYMITNKDTDVIEAQTVSLPHAISLLVAFENALIDAKEAFRVLSESKPKVSLRLINNSKNIEEVLGTLVGVDADDEEE